jgi:hypothetical protein
VKRDDSELLKRGCDTKIGTMRRRLRLLKKER